MNKVSIVFFLFSLSGWATTPPSPEICRTIGKEGNIYSTYNSPYVMGSGDKYDNGYVDLGKKVTDFDQLTCKDLNLDDDRDYLQKSYDNCFSLCKIETFTGTQSLRNKNVCPQVCAAHAEAIKAAIHAFEDGSKSCAGGSAPADAPVPPSENLK